jgi:hypothetical protein
MLPKLIANVKFKDGIEASGPQAKAASDPSPISAIARVIGRIHQVQI